MVNNAVTLVEMPGREEVNAPIPSEFDFVALQQRFTDLKAFGGHIIKVTM